MKTKFIKVPVSEGLPEKTDWYYTEDGLMYWVYDKQEWQDEAGDEDTIGIDFYFEEVEDREDEMREMLEAYQEWNKKYPSNKIFSHSEMQKIIGELDSIMDKSGELLNKQ